MIIRPSRLSVLVAGSVFIALVLDALKEALVPLDKAQREAKMAEKISKKYGEEPPKCSICEQPMKVLATLKRGTDVAACTCDGELLALTERKPQ